MISQVVHFCGTNGSGKTWLAQQVLARFGLVPWRGRPLTPEGGKADRDTILGYVTLDAAPVRVSVLGKYETACGGCDSVPTQDEVCARVRDRVAAGYHVLFEGLLPSGLFSRYLDLDRSLRGRAVYHHVALNTSLEQCIAQVQARRDAAGNTKPFDPHRTLVGKWHGIHRKFEKLRAQPDALATFRPADQTTVEWVYELFSLGGGAA